MNEKISSYLDSVIPKRISKDKRQKLFDELSCHLAEKTADFEELGYSEDESLKKAFEAFAETDETKKIIFDEFDEMYHEKTVWAFLAAIGIFLTNMLSFPLDSWLYAADANHDTNTLAVAESFTMIFAIISLIFVARAKGMRKTLIGIAVGVLAVAVLPLWNVHAQAAIYALVHAPQFFLNEYTNAPLITTNPDIDLIVLVALNYVVFPLSAIVFCIVSSIRITRGKAKRRSKHQILGRYAVFATVFLCITAALSAVATPMVKLERYNGPFNNIMEKTAWSERIFDDISDCTTVKECDSVLRDAGMIKIEEYRAMLSRARQKVFDIRLREFQIPDSLTTYIMLTEGVPVFGNGFIFIGSDGEYVTVKGVGSAYVPAEGEKLLEHLSYNGEDGNPHACTEFFGSLTKGRSEEEVLKAAAVYDLDEYAVFRYGNNMETTARRLYFPITVYDGTAVGALVELFFTDGRLTHAEMRRRTRIPNIAFDETELITMPN